MSQDTITYKDIEEYEDLFKKTPSFLIKSMAKRNSNLALKFESTIKKQLENMNQEQKDKLDIILKTDADVLQSLMREAYDKTKVKQYKVLGNPKYKEFIEKNISEIKKMC